MKKWNRVAAVSFKAEILAGMLSDMYGQDAQRHLENACDITQFFGVDHVGAPHSSAAFINALAEEGTREELVMWLQKTWNEICALQKMQSRLVCGDR